MPGPKVFVSYSHRDGKALAQLQRFLRSLEREGLLAAWADTGLHGGDDWKREIDKALAEATVAVLLISQDFLDSSFIVKEEMPRILEREAAGGMAVLPVFLSPSLAGDVGFPDPRTGGRTKILLTKFQGYGTPAKPLSGIGWSDRERTYAELARRLLALTGTDPVGKAASGGPALQASPAVSAAAPSPGPARAFELTVQLEERGGSFQVTYHLPGREPIGSSARPGVDALRRIDPIHETLDTANNRSLLQRLGSSPAAWGEVLFDLLFGPVEQWEPIFRTLFGRPAGTRPNPSLFPVRLRVHAEDSRLTGLPWRLTSWKGQPLLDAEWTFTTTQTADPAEDPLTTAPSNVLVAAPQTAGGGGGPHDPEHARAVSDVLAKAWPTGRDPGYVQTVRTRAQLEQGLRSLRPHVLYLYGRGAVAGGRPSFLLEGTHGIDPLPLADLRRLFTSTGHAPAVVYLNTEGLNDGIGNGGALPTPDQILGGGVPLLLWRRRPEWSADSTTTALLWLHRWLAQGEDPVAAFHQIQRDALPPSCEASTLAIHSNYRGWRTATYQAAPQRHYPSLRLDRDHQKSLVRKHLEELVRSGTRRVMALVPFAAPGNSIPSLWEQLRHDLELSLGHLADMRWVRLQFPVGRADLRHDLEEELKLQLDAKPNEPVPYLLRRHAPKAVGPGRKPVLCLDWGAFGSGSGLEPKLADAHLEAWLRFSSEFLGTQCPDDLRIISYAALEMPAAEHEGFARKLQEQRRQPWCRTPRFRLSELPPLGKVAESDLLDFLEEPANSSCDAGIQQEVAERIIARTGGAFEETVALLQEAESGSWYDLLAQLRNEQGADTARGEVSR